MRSYLWMTAGILTSCVCLGRTISVGAIGGARVTDDLTGAGATSVSKRYVVGPALDIGLPLGLGVDRADRRQAERRDERPEKPRAGQINSLRKSATQNCESNSAAICSVNWSGGSTAVQLTINRRSQRVHPVIRRANTVCPRSLPGCVLLGVIYHAAAKCDGVHIRRILAGR